MNCAAWAALALTVLLGWMACGVLAAMIFSALHEREKDE